MSAIAQQLTLWKNARILPHAGAELISDGVLAVAGSRIVWQGAAGHLPEELRSAATQIDLQGQLLTPGLIDCHTHLVYGGNRAQEFAMRLHGASYSDIAQAGGGIMSTVRATRDATQEALFAAAAQRLEAMLACGVTAVEIKSGYGLDLVSERKLLQVARALGRAYPVTVSTTFLGAHALPPEFAGHKDDYIAHVCNDMLPALHAEGLIDAVDVFCEGIAFDLAQTQRVFDAAAALGIPIKLHAEQLSNIGGSKLAASYQALSTDHLEYLDEEGVIALRKAGTVAVLLPGAYYFLRETKLPPVELLRRHGVPIAVATDCNPGTSPLTSLLLTMNMASVLFRLTPEENFAGVTLHAARALGLDAEHGSLAVGRMANFAVWEAESIADFSYAIGGNPHRLTVYAGQAVAGPSGPALAVPEHLLWSANP